MDQEKLRFPTGTFADFQKDTTRDRAAKIAMIRDLPDQLDALSTELDSTDWSRRYREGSWTGLQVLHHIADSHLNAFCRIKLCLTEDRPTVKPYDENRWVETADVLRAAPDSSLGIIRGIQHRMALLLESIADTDWARVCIHPEHGRELSVEFLCSLYAWHGRHHLGHLELIRKGSTA